MSNLSSLSYRLLAVLFLLAAARTAPAASIEMNSGGGTTPTNGLHFYIEDTTHIQVRRKDNTGQLYNPNVTPPSNNLDNGVMLRANGLLYGPKHTVGGGFNPSGGMYNTYAIGAVSPANPSSPGVQQTATGNFGIAAGPQVNVVWKYTTPLDFLTAEVTLTIPSGYPVSAANPVRYFHVIDTYLGGSDNGCGVRYTDANSKLVVGTYPPPSGTSCPSSTAIPAGVSVVESFRERSGKTFSSYCAAGWSSFYATGGVNCSVAQSAPLSNYIATTYQDTGVAVAFDFTASGTYTFSYDFVIGTTVVPAYDHIEIRHDGSATLCPENLTVLACTTSGVPCNVGDIVNTGTITGNVTVTPAAPAVTVTPGTFSIGFPSSVANVVLQGSAPGGTYTLGAANISGTPPLNGTKCWNGSSASCTLVIGNTPCVANFECMETGVAYNDLSPPTGARNPLYTKLAGTDFKFDVVALQAGGAVASGYTGNVMVELFDDSASSQPACNAYSSPVATQALSFAAGDSGRKTLTGNINLPRAYRKLRCRVTDSTTVVAGCSSDDFAVRPLAIASVGSGAATADGSGVSASNTPAIKTGAAFDLTANTNTVGYDDKPKIDANKLEWLGVPAGGRTAPGTGTLSGLFSNAANGATGNGASGNAFAYDEVGYFRFQALGVYDDSFTTYSNDVANGDCTDDASNSPVGGKYGCKFGNPAASQYFGRFIPDHFALAGSVLTNGCAAGAFTYMDQPFGLTASIEARNAGNTKTFNYSGAAFGKGVVTPQMLDTLTSAPFTTTVVAAGRLGGLGAPGWSAGAYPFGASNVFLSRLAAADGPYDNLAFGLGVSDVDGVPLWNRDMDAGNPACTPDPLNTSSAAPGACQAVKFATTRLRYGRVKLVTAHGSELLALPVPLRLEYWSGNSGWKLNTLDSCSSFAVSNFSLAFPAGTAGKPNRLAACETMLSVAGTPPAQTLRLSAPGAGNDGWTDLTLNLDAPAGNQCAAIGAAGPAAVGANKKYLQFNWLGTGAKDPVARETFGVYKNANEFIYLRELH